MKRLLAERDLEIDVTQGSHRKKVVGCTARREVVGFIKTKKISERRACRLVSLNRKSRRYQKRLPRRSEITKRLCQLVGEHPRFGYRRIHALLRRESFKINLERVYRLWKRQNLSLPKRRPRKVRAKTTFGIIPKARQANQIWTYDFVFDQRLSGKSLKMLTLIDEFTRECLAVEVGVSIKSARVRQILEKVCAGIGKPEIIRSDNGSEFTGKAVGAWLQENGIKPLFIEQGKPWQNGKGDAFQREVAR